MRRSLFVLALVAFAAPVQAQEVTVERVEVIDTGIFSLVLGEETDDPNLPGEKIVSVDSAEIVKSTTTVPARIGLEFGIAYRIIGEPEGSDVALGFHFEYPEPGLADPEIDSPLLVSDFTRQRTIGKTEYTGFGFENDWELVPGTWTFAIRHEGETLAERTFTVTK